MKFQNEFETVSNLLEQLSAGNKKVREIESKVFGLKRKLDAAKLNDLTKRHALALREVDEVSEQLKSNEFDDFARKIRMLVNWADSRRKSADYVHESGFSVGVLNHDD